MNINSLLDLLPKKLTSDNFFQNIKRIIIEAFANKNTRITEICLHSELASKVSNLDSIVIDNGLLMQITYYYGDTIVKLLVNADEDGYYVQFEEEVNERTSCTTLLKRAVNSIVEVKTYEVENGYYKSFDTEAYYNANYEKLPADSEGLNNAIFADHFGIS